MMESTARPRPSRAGGILTALGGILVLVSSFPIWGRVSSTSGGQHSDVKAGGVVLVAGIVLIVVGLLLVLVGTRGARIALAVLAILGGVGVLLVSIVNVTSKDTILNTVADNIADRQGVDHKVAERQFKQALDAGAIKVETGLGAYIALGGGVLVLIGGIVGLRKGRSGAPAPTAWPAQPGYPPAGGVPPATAPPYGAPPAAAPPSGPPPSGPPPSGPPPTGPPPGSAPPQQPPPADGGGSFTQ